MKRREFILGAGSSASTLFLSPANALTPCPPVFDGETTSVLCPAGDPEADWISRISGPGVVWHHNFASDDEVDAFRWTAGYSGGNDPDDLGDPGKTRRITSDGVTGGGCLEIIRPAGSAESPVWWRPFDPLDTGSGKSVDDPGAGIITPRAWTPTNGGSQNAQWDTGYYGHPDYNTASRFDGHDYYLQIRVKMDPNRITGGNEAGTVGKFVWTTLAGQSLTAQETVIWSHGNGGNQGAGKNYLRVYAFGVVGLGPFDPLNQEDPDPRIQIANESPADFYYSGGWDTLLIHQRPGKAGVTSGPDSELLEIWAANAGETEYTRIWRQEFGRGTYENDTTRWGMQALRLSAYNNGFNFPQGFYHRYDEIIFSKEFIPCPQS